jgi:hypothetical protein
VIYDQPRSEGAAVTPWIVSDDKVTAEAARRLNDLDWFYVTSAWCKRTFEEAGVQPSKMLVLPEGVDTGFWSPSGTAHLDDWRNRIMPMWRSRHVNRLRLEAIRQRTGIATSSLAEQTGRQSASAPVDSTLNNIVATARLLANPSQVRLLTVGEDATSKGFQEVLRGLADTDHANVSISPRSATPHPRGFMCRRRWNLLRTSDWLQESCMLSAAIDAPSSGICFAGQRSTLPHRGTRASACRTFRL